MNNGLDELLHDIDKFLTEIMNQKHEMSPELGISAIFIRDKVR